MSIPVNRIIKNIQMIDEKSYKKTFFALSSTTKKTKNLLPYVSPNRFFHNFNCTGSIIFKLSDLEKIIPLVDGKVDNILIDTEKLIYNDLFNKNGKNKLVSLSKSAIPHIKRSNFSLFKPNDITAEAVWEFVVNMLRNRINSQRVSIIGLGNLGTKIALKFLEAGSSITVYRRNFQVANSIAETLKVINSFGNKNLFVSKDHVSACKNADIIIGCTPGIPVIDIECIMQAAGIPLCIDVGKNTFTKSAIRFANAKNINIYRTDITSTLEGAISSILRERYIAENCRGRKSYNGINLVSGGIIGSEGDFIVDNFLIPKHVYGVADGSGDLKRELTQKQQSIIEYGLDVIEQ